MWGEIKPERQAPRAFVSDFIDAEREFGASNVAWEGLFGKADTATLPLKRRYPYLIAVTLMPEPGCLSAGMSQLLLKL